MEILLIVLVVGLTSAKQKLIVQGNVFSLLYSNSSHLIFSMRSLDFFAQKAMTNKKSFQINFYYISSTSVQLDKDIWRIFFFSFGVLLLPWNNLYKKRAEARQKQKMLCFIYDNKQNSKRLEYKWMSVKCFVQQPTSQPPA